MDMSFDRLLIIYEDLDMITIINFHNVIYVIYAIFIACFEIFAKNSLEVWAVRIWGGRVGKGVFKWFIFFTRIFCSL
jgi:hypothetical protein